jgi:hypothetical protein
LQRFQALVVIALGREDQRVAEQVAHLGERNAALDQPGGGSANRGD